jgi:hypothetical protein
VVLGDGHSAPMLCQSVEPEEEIIDRAHESVSST